MQLATDIDVTQKTAWHIPHKVRTLFRQYEDVVKCDKMHLGGRETNMSQFPTL